jgi:hypothetical protein
MSDEKYIAKLGKLLRQAEKAATPAEAEAFMSVAQRLSTSHAIDLEVARQHQADEEKRETPIQKHIIIGESGKRGLFTYVELFSRIASVNEVKINIAHNSTYVIAFGFPSDIEVVEALYASLVLQMVHASDEYIRSGEYKAETVLRPVYRTVYDSWDDRYRRRVVDYNHKPVHATTARVSFQKAFADKIGQRLRTARREAVAEAEARRQAEPQVAQSESNGTELVLANKAVEVADFYNQKSDARGSWKGGQGVSSYSAHAAGAGREAGARARLGGERAITTGQRQVS